MTYDPHKFLDAHSRYQGYRDAAFHQTWLAISGRVGGHDIRILPINQEAMAFWQAISSFGATFRSGGFPWDHIFDQLYTTPRRFDIAIWDGPVLCGMAAGKASRGNENVTIKWMERFANPGDPLRGWIATTVFTAADHYAKILGRQYLMLRNPLPGTEALYRSHGFSLAPSRFGVPYYQRLVP